MNRFLDIPLLKTRFLHWGNYLYKMNGYLHWGLNYYLEGQDPFELTNPMLAPSVHAKKGACRRYSYRLSGYGWTLAKHEAGVDEDGH